MKYDAEQFKANYKNALADLRKLVPTTGAADGVVCVVASLRTVRNALLESMGEDESIDTAGIKEQFSEMIKQLSASDAPKLAGFASNASAAAAACKLKTESTTASALAGLDG